MTYRTSRPDSPSLAMAMLPILMLLAMIVAALVAKGADFVATYSFAFLLIAALAGILLAFATRRFDYHSMRRGMWRSASQTIPAVPILLLIGTVSATWMLSGVVPMMIDIGLRFIHPQMFLVITCGVCAFISIMTGSSWTTIATIGVAFVGIGTLLGYSTAWVAGAIISGAYFGDKVSPLSDTTVLSASSTGVDLFRHIRYMLITTVPTIVISMIVFAVVGFLSDITLSDNHSGMVAALRDTFHLSPWIMVIPVATMILIVLRINTLITLLASTLMGVAGIFIFQPHLFHHLSSSGMTDGYETLSTVMTLLLSDTSLSTGDAALDSLVSTGGVKGMLPTVWLVLSAMLFGGVMMGCGYIARITEAVTRLLRNRVSAVAATAASGLFLNSATADQYLSIIIGANMYRDVYSRLGLEGRLLSRTIEDSVSVTSVLIPWNSCGVTQSSVLGVATLAYMPFCVFNWLSPIMSVLIAISGFRIVERSRTAESVVDGAVAV